MPLTSQTTAEYVMGAVEAVVVNGSATSVDLIAAFLGTTVPNATAAIEMAVELGLLVAHGADFITLSPLCRFTTNAEQKTAVLRILLEHYRPFTVFRERLLATADQNTAAQHTIVFCGLTAHRDVVKETLISLGTFARALVHEGGGHFQLEKSPLANSLQQIAAAATDMVIAEGLIRNQLGDFAQTVLQPHRDAVIVPLADALMKANVRDGSGAVQQAGNAVESHIVAMAGRMVPPVNVVGATGIIQKLERFGLPPRHLPRYLIHMGSYLGAIRNAADHGPDADINNQPWEIRDETGLEYVFVACSFIAATIGIERGQPPEI
jgi:hypothetical protein